MPWSLEQEEAMKVMWAGGLTASQIAEALGPTITRSAVLGKVHRLKLVARKVPSQPRAPRKTAHKARRPNGFSYVIPKISRAVSETQPRKITLEEPMSLSVPLEALEELHCRYPVDDGPEGVFLFCGHRKAVGAYCEWHARLCYVPARERNRRIESMVKAPWAR